MKSFFRYLTSNKKLIVLLLLFALILLSSFVLYRLPLSAVLYPLGICLLFTLVYLLADWRHEKLKVETLLRLQEWQADSVSALPKPDTAAEEEYAALLDSLSRKLTETVAEKEAAYQDMVDYYTVWAHQIKTPIASMKLTLENEDSPLSQRLAADLFRTGQYVDMVMAFLRLGSEHTDYLFQPYSLDDMIRSSVRQFSNEFISRKLSLRFEPTGLVTVTDEKWFTFVIRQLISNSLKYTLEGCVFIFLHQDGRLCIADTGIGIAPEDLPRITEKGYTGFNGRTDKSASGLGLYLCREICDRLGIGMEICSVQSEGTQVYLSFQKQPVGPI